MQWHPQLQRYLSKWYVLCHQSHCSTNEQVQQLGKLECLYVWTKYLWWLRRPGLHLPNPLLRRSLKFLSLSNLLRLHPAN